MDMPQQRGFVIVMRTDIARDLPPIKGVAGEIREALINLILNAADAMPEGGTITLRAYVAETSSPVTERPYRTVRIADRMKLHRRRLECGHHSVVAAARQFASRSVVSETRNLRWRH